MCPRGSSPERVQKAPVHNGAQHRLGEPYGTLILALSITCMKAMNISVAMLHGENNPTLTRDTLFTMVMIILNGMMGLSLLLGGRRFREQQYNLQGANTYLGVIIPLVGAEPDPARLYPDHPGSDAGLRAADHSGSDRSPPRYHAGYAPRLLLVCMMSAYVCRNSMHFYLDMRREKEQKQ